MSCAALQYLTRLTKHPATLSKETIRNLVVRRYSNTCLIFNWFHSRFLFSWPKRFITKMVSSAPFILPATSSGKSYWLRRTPIDLLQNRDVPRPRGHVALNLIDGPAFFPIASIMQCRDTVRGRFGDKVVRLPSERTWPVTVACLFCRV